MMIVRWQNFWRSAEWGFATAMKIVPERQRFGLCLTLAQAAVPFFRMTSAYREQPSKRYHSPYEISLFLILNALTKNCVTFDPLMIVNDFALCERARATGKGILIIGHHAALTLLLVRFLYDKGLDPIVLTPDANMRVGGRDVVVRTVQPSPTFLVKIRTRLRRGDVVCAMPDRAEPHGDRTFDFETESGRVIVAPALMHVAARCGAEVLFAKVHVKGRQLVATITAPSAASADAAAVTDEFVAFIRSSTTSHAAVSR